MDRPSSRLRGNAMRSIITIEFETLHTGEIRLHCVEAEGKVTAPLLNKIGSHLRQFSLEIANALNRAETKQKERTTKNANSKDTIE